MKAAVLASVGCAIALSTPSLAQNNPVVTAARDILPHSQESLVEAAEEMPQDKYSFKPTPQQMTFAHLVGHIAGSNNLLCSSLSGQPAPPKPPNTETKDELVNALKQSFQFKRPRQVGRFAVERPSQSLWRARGQQS
jgi:hypothetical protein